MFWEVVFVPNMLYSRKWKRDDIYDIFCIETVYPKCCSSLNVHYVKFIYLAFVFSLINNANGLKLSETSGAQQFRNYKIKSHKISIIKVPAPVLPFQNK